MFSVRITWGVEKIPDMQIVANRLHQGHFLKARDGFNMQLVLSTRVLEPEHLRLYCVCESPVDLV